MGKGVGYDFWGLRSYLPGDSYAHIDWKARARTGELHVREFLRDTAYHLVLLCDVSPSMRYGGKYEHMADLASSLAHAALRANNAAGILLFTDRVVRFVPPLADPRYYYRLIHVLQSATPQVSGGPTSLFPALELVRRKVPSCLGVILSDFLCDLEGLERFSEAASRGRVPAHEWVAVHVLEEIEQTGETLREGQLVARDMETGAFVSLNWGDWKRYAAETQDRLELVIERLSGLGIDSVVVRVGEEGIQEKVNAFFARRARARV